MATVNDFISAIISVIATATNFKVGKTGQTIDDRFRGEHAYNYKKIKEIGFSTDKDEIDSIEISLIGYFKTNYKNCDNEQKGGGDMGKSDRYRIYIVWN